jgi:hypothetical protein
MRDAPQELRLCERRNMRGMARKVVANWVILYWPTVDRRPANGFVARKNRKRVSSPSYQQWL